MADGQQITTFDDLNKSLAQYRAQKPPKPVQQLHYNRRQKHLCRDNRSTSCASGSEDGCYTETAEGSTTPGSQLRQSDERTQRSSRTDRYAAG